MYRTNLVAEREHTNMNEAHPFTPGFKIKLQPHSLLNNKETHWVFDQVHRLSEGLRVLALEDQDKQGFALPPPVALNTAGGSAAPLSPVTDLKTYLHVILAWVGNVERGLTQYGVRY